MSNYKFDSFYYSEDQSTDHYLSEIEHLSDDDYNESYKDKMYCPWCKGPQLSRVINNGSIYLRAYPKQTHKIINHEICPYTYNAASQRTVEKYVNELRSKKKTKSVLESIMRMMFRKRSLKNTALDNANNSNNNPLLIKKEKKDKTTTKNVIPHYNLKNWGRNIPQDQLLVAYGKVYIELIEKNIGNSDGISTSQTYMHFRDIKTHIFLTSCRMPNGLNIHSGNYCVVALGKCIANTTKSGKIYYNLHLNHPDTESILIKELEESN